MPYYCFLREGNKPEINLQNLGVEGGVVSGDGSTAAWWGSFSLEQSLWPFLAGVGRATLGKAGAQAGQGAGGHDLARAPCRECCPRPVLLCLAFCRQGLFLPCGKATVSRDGLLARSATQGLRVLGSRTSEDAELQPAACRQVREIRICEAIKPDSVNHGEERSLNM